MNNLQELVNFIWSIADLLRGDFKQSEYGRVILPLIVLRRFDCLLADTKSDVLAKNGELAGANTNVDAILKEIAGQRFYNTSQLGFAGIAADPNRVADNLRAYIAGFSRSAIEVLDSFGLDAQIRRLDGADLLYVVVDRLASIDLRPRTVGNDQMGYVFEELIRRFSQLSNETSGEHFTPRDVIRLMASLLLSSDEADLESPSAHKTIYDPACGTGGILTETEKYLISRNTQASIEVYGQEINRETYAICRSDMMLKGADPEHIKLGNSLSDDQHASRRGEFGFDYMLSNPPWGVEWKRIRRFVEHERDTLGFAGRFGAGTPRINDGSLLFLQHMLSKMRPVDLGGSRIAITFNGSPMFTGAAGSGESEIRRWIIENDWLEAIIALPDQLFYNTGSSTYFWTLSNRKIPALAGKVILLDGREYCSKMRRSLGDKRKMIDESHIVELTEIYRGSLAIAADASHPHHAKVKVYRAEHLADAWTRYLPPPAPAETEPAEPPEPEPPP